MSRRLFFGLLLLALLLPGGPVVLVACVNGSTPDCSMPNNNCGPAIVDASLTDAPTSRDSGAGDVTDGGEEGDAPLDAKMDGDESGG